MAESKKRTLDDVLGNDNGHLDKSDGRSVKQKVDLQVETVVVSNGHEDHSDKYYGADSKSSDSVNSSGSGMGFLAYSKINPFAAAQGNAFAQLTPSPQNPFQTTSPKHNPFMSFVDKKEEYWAMMSTNPSLAKTSSMFGFSSETVANTILNARGGVNDGPEKQSQFGGVKLSDSTAEARSSGSNSPDSVGKSDTASPERASVVDFEGSTGAFANGEEGEECVFQVRVKLFRLGAKEALPPGKPALCAKTTKTSDTAVNSQDKSSDATEVERKEQTENCSIKESEHKDDVAPEDIKSDADAVVSKDETSSDVKPLPVTTVTEWVEVGTGPLRVLRPSISVTDSKKDSAPAYPRMVMRRECQPGGHGTKLLLNEFLKGHTAVSKMGDKAVRLTVISMVEEKALPISYLLKTKLTTETEKLEKWMSDLLASTK